MVIDKSEKAQVDLAWFQELHSDLQSELDMARREVNDISLMLEQSQIEVGKLTQRNAAATARLQQAQAQLERLPPHEIRAIYDQALDAQQRLFMMRGQLEKLQSDRSHLQRYASML
jgi:two-component system, NarL family, sensor histidine kinase DegS